MNARRAGRVRPPQITSVPAEVSGGQGGCPFCPENIDQAVTRFDPRFHAAGRIRRGECVLFPNVFPLASHHIAATVCASHFLGLHEFTAPMVSDFVAATREFLSLVHTHDPVVRYPILLWNHLSPSGASMVHPHVQVLVDRRPTSYQEVLLEASSQYHGRTGRSFWKDIVDEEKQRGERFIEENASVAALASFAPQGNREVQIIFKRTGNLLDLQDTEITDFAECVVRVLRAYKAMGVNSFNMSTFSGPMDGKLEYYSLHAKMISRPVLEPFYRNDTGILERFHHDADIDVMPESFTENARRVWGR